MKKITLLLFAIFSVFQVSGQVSSYAFSQSNGTYTALSGATVLATQTVANGTAAGALDDVIYPLPLPFAFSFNGVSYPAATNINVSSNGFITFGAIAPLANNYVPISNASLYEGALVPYGVDANGGYGAVGTTTSGSADIAITAGTTSEYVIGAPVAGTGIPAGATVVSVTPTTVTISANCTSTGTGRTISVALGEISYQVLGSAPNQKLVIQFKRMRQYNTSLRTIDYQVVLNETTNVVDFVYGFSIGSTLTNTTPQVGLRGATNTAYNNRTSTTSWSSTTAGAVNTATVTFNSTSFPASGLTFSWTPPVPCDGTPTPGTVAPTNLILCTGTLPGNLVVSGFSSGVTGLVIQWQESPDGVTWGDAVGGSGATTTTYTPPAYLGTPIQYRARVTCTNSGLFDFSTPTLIGNAANPTTQVTNVNATNLSGPTATLNWTNGNGTRRLVVLSDASFITPVNGTGPVLVANTVYAGSGEQIVYDGAATTVTVSGLLNGATYNVRVYEYLRCGAGPHDYYFNTSIGTNAFSFVTPNIPANDDCAAAVSLTVGNNFAANAVVATNGGATASQIADPTIPAPACSSYLGGDIWYSVTVPSSGSITIETSNSVGSTITDTGIVVYSGTCGALVTVECDDDDSLNGNFSLISLTGRTPGEVLFIRAFEYGNNAFGEFQISVFDCPSTLPAPTGDAAQTFCSYNNPTVANLAATGTAIKWYDAPVLGNLLLSTDALVSGNIYYASQTVGCEGLSRLAVTATINNTPVTPTGDANQTFCSASSPTLASLAVTGTGLVWYDAATLGNVLPSSTVLTATTYYVASNDGTCESSRLAITTTEDCPVVGCLNAPSGQWPGGGAGYTPATCNGLVENVIATNAYAGEYSLVNVTLGQTYVFKSTINSVHDFVTISADAGVTAVAAGTSPLTWVSTVTGQIRFYSHVDNACGTSTANRTRAIICGTPSLALPDYVSLQWPPTATIAQGGTVTVYGQVYEAGLTDVVPNIDGQAPGINAWVGYSTTNTNPNTWTNWVVATHNAGNIGNNDEYQAAIGATLTPGTYYYATRFNLDGGAYVYGGINAASPNNGNFWDGATFGSGVLTITPPPAPANDDCSGAIALTVNSDYACATVTPGTVIGATASSTDATACFGTEDDDVWFSFVATSTTHRVSLLNIAGSTTDLYHSVWTGVDCSSLALVPASCSDGNTSNPAGLVIGQTYYVRVNTWTATAGQTSTFNICIGTPPPPPTNDNFATPIAVSCGNIYTGDTSSPATLDEDSAPDGFGTDLDAPNLWYSFTGTGAAQTVTVNLCGSSYDTSVLVYTGTSGNLTLIAANDDDATCVSNGANSSLSFASDGTTTYYITVEGWNVGNVGAFTMNVTCAAVTPPAVANQDCGTALAVLVDGSDNNSDNSFGTVSSTQPGCDLFGSIQDVWFSFVAPASGSVTALLTPGTMTSLNYNVYSGTCGALTAVGNCTANQTAANTQQYTTLTAGQTYYVQVWSNAAEQGTFTLRITDDGLGNGSFDDANFTYYPNPVKNTLNLSYNQEISNVEVYNLLGQRVSAISVNANQTQIDMSNLPSAAYIVKVTSNNQVKTVRVIKE